MELWHSNFHHIRLTRIILHPPQLAQLPCLPCKFLSNMLISGSHGNQDNVVSLAWFTLSESTGQGVGCEMAVGGAVNIQTIAQQVLANGCTYTIFT